jgi:hypothetical protein
METLTARETSLQRTSGHRAPMADPKGH